MFCLDMTTAKNLELLSCSRDPATPYSLANVINFTKTRGGGMYNNLATTVVCRIAGNFGELFN